MAPTSKTPQLKNGLIAGLPVIFGYVPVGIAFAIVARQHSAGCAGTGFPAGDRAGQYGHRHLCSLYFPADT